MMIILQIWISGWRWPMIPLYLFTIAFTILLTKIHHKVRNLRKVILTALLLVFALVLPGYLFPWYTIAEPSGAYKVGTHSYEVVDHTRDERWSNIEQSRRIMVQLWYPTEDVNNTSKAPYHEHPSLFMKEFAESNGIPGFLLQSFAKQKTPAYKEADLLDRDQPYPLIFFSHGLGSNRSQNQFQVIELASHGYIVVGIDHTYYSPGTVFPDGTKPGLANIEFSESGEIMDPYIFEWSEDARSVLNWLEQVAEGDIDLQQEQFIGQIDLRKVGYLGHSFGGATASHTLAVDDRFRSGINMDGFPYGKADELGVEQPFLTLMSDTERVANYIDDKEYLEDYYQKVEKISGKENVISLEGALHLDFSDFPLLSPITSWVGMTGRMQHKKINKMTLEFFHETLQ